MARTVSEVPVTPVDRFQAVIDKLNKDFGEGSVIRLDSERENVDISVISSGSLGLDKALGTKGYPVGRVVEIYGPESSGKTTLCLEAIREAQKLGKKAAIIDMEHALDLNYASDLGVRFDSLTISQPSYGEEALNLLKAMVESGEYGIIVVDSVAALVPKSESDGDIGDANVGKHARLMSQSLRILTPLIGKSDCLVIFTNQIRMKIGVMFGSPETTSGGEALKFFASVRIDIRKQQLKDGDEAYANKVKAKIVKNKVSRPYKTAEFNILYGKGIDRVTEIIDYAVLYGHITKAGSWYSIGERRIGQGEDTVVQFLCDNPELLESIETLVKESLWQE